MKTTRDITFEDRVFTIPDLTRLAGILDRQIPDPPDQWSFTSYEVAFEDGHRIEGQAVEVFAEEQLNRPSRPAKIEMLANRSDGRIAVHIRAAQSAWKYENSVSVSGSDTDWVNASYAALGDALMKVAPQDFWWRNHPTLLFVLNTLGLAAAGNLLTLILAFLVGHLSTDPGSGGVKLALSFLRFVGPAGPAGWPCWVVSSAWFAKDITDRLLAMWPSIEFSFGSKYLRNEKRREKLNWTLTAVIIPLLVAAIYDLLKAVIQ